MLAWPGDSIAAKQFVCSLNCHTDFTRNIVVNSSKSNKTNFLILALLFIATGWILYQQVYRNLLEPVTIVGEHSEAGQVIVQIKPGTSFTHLARQLRQQQLISNQLVFVLYGRLLGHSNKIQAGEYAITAGTTPVQLLNQFVSGAVTQYTFSIIEGWSFRQLMQAVSDNTVLENTLAGLDDAAIMERLGYKGEHPEGRFFADTYTFSKADRDIDILQRAYQKMEQVLADEWSTRDKELPYKNAYEALIMASIVEKETGLAAERKKIAGVFVRRLQKNMRLQTDPTVIYGLGDQYQGNLTRKHLLQTTPYNTYRVAGLPPTPIAMPGWEAIHAALHPAAGSSLYFVAKGDGSHYFSETLAEHTSAVKKYQWQRVEDYRSAPK